MEREVCIVDNKEKAKVFKAFCDERRLVILELLKSGEKCACEIMDNIEIGQSAVSYHMKILCEAKIVESRQQGKWTHYKISKSGTKYAKDLLDEILKEDL